MTTRRNLYYPAAMCFFLGMTIPSAFASNAWYWGKVTQIITSGADGSFIAYIDNPTLISDCLYPRVTFQVSDMGAERTKAALSMALMAHASGKDFGVVVDLQVGQACYASSTSTQGAGVKD